MNPEMENSLILTLSNGGFLYCSIEFKLCFDENGDVIQMTSAVSSPIPKSYQKVWFINATHLAAYIP